ncbi:hypothetical protein [Aporhodopirellula aestuarii]|uniref:Uncharacterized protein n=1 Tax=Aporhodopirellula aestuarii TaxID=2950107 RepID=A0ABT0TWT7_9BACT|nr:hypothetical protein [Aporhodopirellula aestuarii]MCM2369082.1 hypothetical protein [Aporhodopirellula aestuarii]
MNANQQIIPGITIGPTGQATVAPAIASVLFDLAINLEESTNLPVDIEHVVAALVLANRNGEIDASAPVSADDSKLLGILAPHVKTVFTLFGGSVGIDD